MFIVLSTIGDQFLVRIMFALSECRLPGVVAFFRLLNSTWWLADVTDGTLETTNRTDHRFGLALVVIAMVSCDFLLIEYGGENWSKDHQCYLPLNFRDHVEITQRRRFIRRFNKWRANSGRKQWKVCTISPNLCTTLQRVLTPKAQLQIDLQCNLFALEFWRIFSSLFPIDFF